MRSQADAAMQRYGLNQGSYFSPYVPQNPSMFGQIAGLAGAVGGDSAAQIVNMLGAMAQNPAIKNLMPGLSGAVTNMMGTMPIGMNQDVGNFMVANMMGRMGVGMTPPPSLPSDFVNIQQAQAFNQAAMQYQANFSNAPAPTLMELAAGDSAQSLRMLQGLANADTLRQDARFKGAFETMSAISGVNMDDPVLQQAIKLGRTGDSAAADAFMKQNQAAVDKAISAANSASGMNAFATNVAPMLMNAGISVDNPVIGGLLEVALNATGADRDPRLFAPAAAQSLAMLGGLNMAGFSGGPGFAAEKVAMGLADRLLKPDQPGGIAGLGMARGVTLTRELAKQGMLTTGGVDTFGNLDTNQVKELEDTIARQLEGFKGISDLSKRINMSIAETVASMKQIYGNDYGRQLASAVGEAERALRADPTNAGKSDEFISQEANRRANRQLLEPISQAVTAGGLVGLDSRQSMGMLMASTDMARGMGLGGRGGVEMMLSATAMMHGMRSAGIAMDPGQALAQAADSQQVYMNTGSGMGLGNLLKAKRELDHILNLSGDPEYEALFQGLQDGSKTQADLNKFLLGKGVDQALLSQYQGANNAAIGAEYDMETYSGAVSANAQRQVAAGVNARASGGGARADLGQVRSAIASLNDPRFKDLAAATTDEDFVRLVSGMTPDARRDVERALVAGGAGNAALSLAAGFNNVDTDLQTAGGSIQAIMLNGEKFRTSVAATDMLKNAITAVAPTGNWAEKIKASGKTLEEMSFTEIIQSLAGVSPDEQRTALSEAITRLQDVRANTTDAKELGKIDSALTLASTMEANLKAQAPSSTSPNPTNTPNATGTSSGAAAPGTNAGTSASTPVVGAAAGVAAGGGAQSTPNPTAAGAATGTGSAVVNQELLEEVRRMNASLEKLNKTVEAALAKANGN